jgi:uncharacterized protein (TIGR02996 family)
MRQQELALLKAIRSQPDFDGPRLVYADWLEEHGDCSRSEFIRIQIARTEMDLFDGRQTGLACRERDLIDEHLADWVGPGLRQFATYQAPPEEPPFEPLDPATTREMVPQPRWCFRRGFPWVEVSAGQFLAHSEMILDASPFIQLQIGQDSFKELIQRSRDPGSVRPRREVFKNLVKSPQLPSSGLGLTLIEESDWELLTQDGRERYLSSLHSRGATAYVWHFREIARVKGLSRLAELSLNQMNLTDPAARELAVCPFMPNLQTLDLRGNHLGPDGIAALISVESNGRLRCLDLSDNPIGDAGVQQLAKWEGLGSVEVLRLEGCQIGPRGAAALAASPNLRRLSQLGLQRNQIRGAGVAALMHQRGADWLGRLAWLDLCGNRIGSVGAQHLAMALPYLRSLRRLYLSEDRDELSPQHLRGLRELFDDRIHLDWFESPFDR